jgi:hypothetical protein
MTVIATFGRMEQATASGISGEQIRFTEWLPGIYDFSNLSNTHGLSALWNSNRECFRFFASFHGTTMVFHNVPDNVKKQRTRNFHFPQWIEALASVTHNETPFNSILIHFGPNGQ